MVCWAFKKLIMKLLFCLAIVLLIILNSCFFEGCKIVNLPSNEKSIIKKFKLNQKFVFKSNFENYDTLTIIENRESYTYCNRLKISKYQFNITRLRLESKK